MGPDGAVVRWVELDGPGPARVYLHGLGAAAAPYFTRVAAHPSLERRRSLLVDLLGFGLSDRPARYRHTLDDHAATVAAVLDRAGAGGADVVGHSMGGAVAVVLAAARPDLVRSLVVVEPNLDPADLEPGSPSSRGIAAWTEAEFVATGFDRLLAAAGGTGAATLRMADPVAVHRSAVALVRATVPSTRELLLALPVPRTLVEGGRSDPDPGRAELAAAGVRCVVVPDAGHDVMLDAPEAFAGVLREALG